LSGIGPARRAVPNKDGPDHG